jgi:endoglucanase
VSTVATADFTAVVATAARVYAAYDADYAATLAEAAERSYGFLTANATPIQPSIANDFTGGYQSSDGDDRLWAAAELWRTTGDAGALADVEARIGQSPNVATLWDWGDTSNLGKFAYALSPSSDRDPGTVAALTSAIVNSADMLVSNATASAWGRAPGGAYYWGINGVVARTVINLMVAYQLQPDDKYLDVAEAQLDHLFGRNYYGRSYVTGIGNQPPLNPHHRPSVSDSVALPWPGLMVGGSWAVDESIRPGVQWTDDSTVAQTNEVAINWNAPLIYALAALLP